ncbi:UNVERIFIED_CONTAM: hypothetical protein PYX00_007691 [Menopon gallinae]|uniref:Coiled-coil domain-containing protein n=1 Tax=Menopon gallinae TaxID=328185 RepID=A0AAW2HJU4_9NEOP
MEKQESSVSPEDKPDKNDLHPFSKDLYRSTHFSSVLSKIDEVDESRLKSPLTSDEFDLKRIMDDNKENEPTQSPHVMWKSEDEIIHIENNKRVKMKQRPKSASCIAHNKKKSVHSKPAPKSLLKSSSGSNRNSDSESNSESSLMSLLGRPGSAGSKPKRHLSWHDRCPWDYYYAPSRPRSACGVRSSCYSDCCSDPKGSWVPCSRYQPRKCRSNPNVSTTKRGTTSNSDLQIDRFKRSLKLLGLEVTDFGIYDSGSEVSKSQRTKGRTKHVESTFSTKVVKRSISLDGLKEEVREAWLDDRLDSSHRKLLAQAAYEEWYFRKEEEAHRKLAYEKMKNKIMKEKLENEFINRKLKAEEQFKKWIEGKRTKLKIEKKQKKPALTEFRAAKSREEVEVAYRRWKKEKDKQREERQKLELEEKQRKLDVEKQKEEKKAMAERAFNEWKRKLVETEKSLAEARLKKERKRKEMERKRREQEKKTSFQTWKDMKDKEMMMKRQKNRNAMRIANAVRSAQMEERMYEAEQAFEEWLEKLEQRETMLKSKTAS